MKDINIFNKYLPLAIELENRIAKLWGDSVCKEFMKKAIKEVEYEFFREDRTSNAHNIKTYIYSLKRLYKDKLQGRS